MTQSPWEKRPNGARPFDDLLKDSQQRLQSIFGQGGPTPPKGPTGPTGIRPKFIGAGLFLLLLLWLGSGFFIVNEDEEGLVMRFGKFVRTATPGPNYHLPTPIESVAIFPVTRVQREEIGFRSSNATARGGREIPDESLMLTGDENIVEIDFVVQWRIRNAQYFAFNVMHPRDTVKSVAESAMREVIGKTELADVLTGGRAHTESTTAQLMQDILDKYKAGIEIISLQLLKVDPPTAEVISAFRDVQTAEQEKEKTINNARGYRNKILPEARGEAAKRMEQAEAYKAGLVERAKGEASRFSAVYDAYKQAKDVTKRRMYLETMEDILQNIDKVIVDNKSGATLPYMPLPMPPVKDGK